MEEEQQLKNQIINDHKREVTFSFLGGSMLIGIIIYYWIYNQSTKWWIWVLLVLLGVNVFLKRSSISKLKRKKLNKQELEEAFVKIRKNLVGRSAGGGFLGGMAVALLILSYYAQIPLDMRALILGVFGVAIVVSNYFLISE